MHIIYNYSFCVTYKCKPNLYREMSTDRSETEFCCSDCNKFFDSASNLLTHFAFHASQVNNFETSKHNGLLCKLEKKCVPDLYPINMIKTKNDKTDIMKTNVVDFTISSKYLDPINDQKDCFHNDSNNSNVQNEFDGDFNPLKYCSISMEIKDQSSSVILSNDKRYDKINTLTEGTNRKKYPCSFCAKVFGWSTDLKRHVLVHTGERPFKCKLCDSSFTRNFLLQKHESKVHPVHLNKTETKLIFKNKTTMPSLKPINGVKAKDSRKQDKQKIKRKCFYDTKVKKNEEFCGLLRSQLNFIDKETIVQ